MFCQKPVCLLSPKKENKEFGDLVTVHIRKSGVMPSQEEEKFLVLFCTEVYWNVILILYKSCTNIAVITFI